MGDNSTRQWTLLTSPECATLLVATISATGGLDGKMSRKLENLRNIGIIAHIDAGKTTVTEQMLFCSGKSHRAGTVDGGTTETDFDEEEQQRGITIYSACVSLPWNNGIDINLLDTPGHVDFTAEVERCLRVLDGGVVIFSAREGVEAQSETVWRQADKYGVPRICFINKMDREGADFEGTVAEIEKRLGGTPVKIQIPVGQGPPHLPEAFRGCIDLITMKYLTFTDNGVKVKRDEIPEELLEDAQLAREEMLEALYNFDDRLMELAMAEEEIPAKLIIEVLRSATLERMIQPLMCGSALDGLGIPPLLDAVGHYLPSPLDQPPVDGEAPGKKKGEKVTASRSPSPKEPFCGLVFKVVPAATGDISWVRVYSGTLKSNSRVLNPGKNKKENVSQLWQIQAARREQVDSVQAGEIVGIIGLRNSVTGDTLCEPQNPILLESIEFPETVISMAIEPETTNERKKLSETLEMMRRQDPTFRARESEDTGQTLISGMGELHLEVIKNRLLRDFNLNVKVHKPRVSYRETIGSSVEVTGECSRVIAGQTEFAEVTLKMEPFTGESSSLVMNMAPTAVDPDLMNAAVDELHALVDGNGVLAGFPLSKIKVAAIGARSDESSTDVAFRVAASAAFEKGLREGGPVLLEPIMKMEITTPEEYMGELIGDLQQRRATIARTEHRGNRTIIEAEAPLAELFGYSSAIRSLSQGLAGHSMEPLHYAPAPPEVGKQFAI